MNGYPVGIMASPGNSHHLQAGAYPAWAADNACFSRGDAFRLDAYLAWLAGLGHRATCLFATAPDVVGDAPATWERSRYVLPVLRALGFRAALVAQDGIEATRIEWDAFDALFIGGSTRWKLSETAYRLVGEARERGKHTHVGRVNSARRLGAFAAAGCDSCDGTFLAFGPDVNTPRLLGWLDELGARPSLWAAARGGGEGRCE